MKIPTRQIESFVKKPDPAMRAILLYGPDRGLMRERSAIIGRGVVSDLADPFRVTILSDSRLFEDPAHLCDEAFSISMMGGDRLIRIEEAEDHLAPILKSYLENPAPHALVLVESGELGPRSALRLLFEKHICAAALPCYVEDAESLKRLIGQTLQAEGKTIAPDALVWLADTLTGDRQRARAEIEKLLVYMGTEARLSLDDVHACCGDMGARTLDDLIYATAGGDTPAALRNFATLTAEGTSFVVMLRALQSHFRRLHLTRSRMATGLSLDQAVKALTPPLFFKWEKEFARQTDRWKAGTLETVLARLNMLEAQCKSTGLPPETLCAQAILGICRLARQGKV